MFSIKSTGSDYANSQIAIQSTTDKLCKSFIRVGQKITRVALPVIGAISLSFLPQVEAGAGLYAACIAACFTAAATTGPGGWCCIACCCAEACAPLLPTPTP